MNAFSKTGMMNSRYNSMKENWNVNYTQPYYSGGELSSSLYENSNYVCEGLSEGNR